MSRVCIIGHYGFGQNLLNGQTIKTKIVTKELQKELGESEIATIDIANGKSQLLKLFFDSKNALKNSTNVIMMPTENGVMYFTPVLSILNHIYKKKLHYIVIGGWLPAFLAKKKWLIAPLKKFKGIYVETSTMKKALECMGFSNIIVMPNCKELKILEPNELIYSHNEPYKLCTFSRVMKEKGIEDIIYAVTQINEQCGRNVFTLDIYGQVDVNQQNWFDNIKSNFPGFIQYKGEVEYDRSVETLQGYFALVFPTKFYTEGIPGTVIDAYAAGLPVISSRWESFEDVIEDGVTGLGYTFDDKDSLAEVLKNIANDPSVIDSMRKSCIERARQFAPDKVIAEKMRGYKLKPLILCTFSRVMKEKGIEDAIEAVVNTNRKLGFEAYSLIIYGQIDANQHEWFSSVQAKLPLYINYAGMVPFDESTDVLKESFALLFPTYYEGEGFAGTIIDAMAAGVPVISSDWKYNREIISQHNTGLLFPTRNVGVLTDILEYVFRHQLEWNSMKTKCIDEAKKYEPNRVIKTLIDRLE